MTPSHTVITLSCNNRVPAGTAYRLVIIEEEKILECCIIVVSSLLFTASNTASNNVDILFISVQNTMRRRNLHSEVNESTHKRHYRSRRTSSQDWLTTPRSRQAAITIVFCLAPSLYWASTSSIYQSNGPTASFLRRKRRGRTLVALRPEIEQLRRQFPIHANEMEEIPHPGILFSGSERAKVLVPELAFPDNLLVPKFWKPSGYGHEGVRHFLGDGGQKLMTPEEAQSIGSVTEDDRETIFVSLASYRDVECRATLESIFLRATHPDRIRVSVVDQIEADDPKCSVPQVPCEQQPDQVLCTYRHLIDVFEVPSYLMVGPVFARHIAYRMYRGTYQCLASRIRQLQDSSTHPISSRRVFCSSDRCSCPLHRRLG